MPRFYSVEEEKRIFAEQAIQRSGKAGDVNLCQYRNLSCVRCCLPHIGGDSHLADPEEHATAPDENDGPSHPHGSSYRYRGPGGLVMQFRNFNPLKDPQIEASQYEDCFEDVGQLEMERRFSERRRLFLDHYNPREPRQSLQRYMQAAQEKEGYCYKPAANSGIESLYVGGSVPARNPRKGELPECQLLGFVDEKGKVGCMAHPLAQTSQGYDGRDQVGFFHHTGCCKNVGCEASREFPYLSASALKIFDKSIAGMSWYAYSRHATSVLVYYLRGYDHLLQKLDASGILDTLTLAELVGFTNSLFEDWPLSKTEDWDQNPLNQHSNLMDSLEILSTGIPLAERILYIALDTRFLRPHFTRQLQQARSHIENRIAAF
ncbi:MAG: hypothetical protein QUT30_20075 [Acidobacteriota bacterium]|nr:hypothetical protein [Acidobacteriota bacterium]